MYLHKIIKTHSVKFPSSTSALEPECLFVPKSSFQKYIQWKTLLSFVFSQIAVAILAVSVLKPEVSALQWTLEANVKKLSLIARV